VLNPGDSVAIQLRFAGDPGKKRQRLFVRAAFRAGQAIACLRSRTVLLNSFGPLSGARFFFYGAAGPANVPDRRRTFSARFPQEVRSSPPEGAHSHFAEGKSVRTQQDPACRCIVIVRGTTTGPWASTATYDSALERFGGRRIEARPSACSNQVLVCPLRIAPIRTSKWPPMDFARLSINLGRRPPFSGQSLPPASRNYNGRRYSLFYTPAGSDAHWSKPETQPALQISTSEKKPDRRAGRWGAWDS